MDGAEEAEKRVHVGTGALQGRALVRERLIRPLQGLPRPRRMGAEQHARDLDGLAERLAYMSPKALDGICELALRVSGGKACPDVGLIRAWAYAVEPPPPRSSDYAQSILRSAMGRQAMEGGYGVELLRHARTFGPPPGRYILAELRERAAANSRRRAEIALQAQAGRASPDQQRWLDEWWADHALCQALQRDEDAGPNRDSAAPAEDAA